ncbi:MAG: M20/M25/M40 family metallo-hydrolase [Actinobacteria bacterium]|nr:M20/M25/M40 family metallo-hydrolase [Actinomycetota bacterium]
MPSDVNTTRMLDSFLRLIRIDGPSRRERDVADYLKERLAGLGFSIFEDDTQAKTGCNAGNVVATLWGTAPGAPAIFFSAHMDTIEPTAGLEPIVEGGQIRSGGQTVLGADDRAGIAAILEGIQSAQEKKIPHGDLQVIFTVGEEIGLVGAKHLDCGRIKARAGFVVDSGEEVGAAVVRAPWEIDFRAIVIGRAAHAGVEPEKGVNAIQVAGKALATMRLGRIDPETTANVGVIRGGSMTNVVPDRAELEGEVRSLNPEKARAQLEEIRGVLRRATESSGARLEFESEEAYPGFSLDEDALPVRLFQAAARAAGLEPRLVPRGGGSDTNIYNSRGLRAVNLGMGAKEEHTHGEHVAEADLERAADLILKIIGQSAKP